MLAKLSIVLTQLDHSETSILEYVMLFSKYFIIVILVLQQTSRENRAGLQLYIYSPQRETQLRKTLLKLYSERSPVLHATVQCI